LEDAIRDFLELRAESARQECTCYYIFVDQSSAELQYFESEQACLDSYPEPTDAAIRCIEDVLGEGPYTEAGNIDVMECFTDVVRADMACFADDVAGTCSTSAYQDCSSMSTTSSCGQALTVDQRGAIMLCSHAS
jgi:hypothetical protein